MGIVDHMCLTCGHAECGSFAWLVLHVTMQITCMAGILGSIP